jgi:hypothetical protein
MNSIVSLLFLVTSSVAVIASTNLPIVDLGYVQQQATYYDSSIDAFTFKNIRYAHPPLAELRFRPPQPPAAEPGLQDGTQYGHPVCPQVRSESGGLSNTSIITEDCLVSKSFQYENRLKIHF